MQISKAIVYLILLININNAVNANDCKCSVDENVSKGATLDLNVYDSCFKGHKRDSKDELTIVKQNGLAGCCSEYFIIDKDGRLRLSQSLDREDAALNCGNDNPCRLQIKVELTPAGKYENIIDKTVIIELKDVNDNYPEFSSDNRILFAAENRLEEEFILPKIHDKDTGNNAKVNLIIQSIEPNKFKDKFDLKSASSNQYKLLVKNLDREEQEIYNITLKACDSPTVGSKSCSTVIVQVIVKDSNDNEPIFSKQKYQFDPVNENVALNYTIGSVLASDADAGKNGEVRYKIIEENDIICSSLIVDSITGNVKLLKKINAAKHHEIQCKISAQDQSIQQQRKLTEAIIIAKFIDINDHPPQFNVRKNNSIKENEQYNSPVLTVKVTDADTGENGRTECNIHNDSSDRFQIEFKNKFHFIYAKNIYDRELNHHDIVVIQCKDFGQPQSLTSTASFTVNIIDVNEFAPTCDKKTQYVMVKENTVNAYVTNVKASDKDAEAELNYQIIDRDSINHKFVINNTTGELRNVVALDREQQASHVITVNVSDGNHSVTCSVQVTVTDINDNAPNVIGDRAFTVNEAFGNEKISQIRVGQLQYTDADEKDSLNSKARFSLQQQQPDQSSSRTHFTIKSNGVIYVSGSPDRELNSKFMLTVKITDNGVKPLSNISTVIVNLLDVNDNKPVIIAPVNNHVEEVTDDHTPGVTVFAVEVKDADVCSTDHPMSVRDCMRASKFKMQLMQRVRMFDINSTTGEIRVVNALTPGIHTLNLSVSDTGEPRSLTSHVTFSIRVVQHNRSGVLFGAGWSAASNWTVLLIIIIVSSFITVILVIAIVMLNRRQPCCYGYSSRNGYTGPKDQHCIEASDCAVLPPSAAAPFTHDGRRAAAAAAGVNTLSTFGQQQQMLHNHHHHHASNYMDSIRRENGINNKELSYQFAGVANLGGGGPVPGIQGALQLPGDYEVASADSGHGASEEDMHQEHRAAAAAEQMRCMTLSSCHNNNQQQLMLKHRPTTSAAITNGCNCIIEEDSSHHSHEHQPLTLLSDPQFNAVSLQSPSVSAAPSTGYMSLSRQPYHTASPNISSRCVTPQHFYGTINNGSSGIGNKQQYHQQV